MQRIKHPQKLGDNLAAPDTCDLTVVVLFEGWLDDLLRLHASLTEHVSGAWRMVVVDNPVDDDASAAIADLDAVDHVPLKTAVGWGAGRNLGLRLATGRLAAVVDTSVEVTGDVAAALEAALNDPTVGLVGRWGVTTADGFEFRESAGPDVDGVEGYLMAARRGSFAEAGLFDPKFRFYRNADIDLSFRFRDAGLRTVVDTTLPVERHAHRLWASTPPEEREEASRRNFFRFRAHWADRPDLLVGAGG